MTQSGGGPTTGPSSGGPSGAAVAGLGLQMVVSIVAGMYAGQWLDRRFASEPWFLVGGVFLGAVLSFYSVYRQLVAESSDTGRSTRKENGS